MHSDLQKSQNPEAKQLLAMGEKVEHLLRQNGIDPTQEEIEIDAWESEFVLYGHNLFKTSEVSLAFNYVLPNENDPEAPGPSVELTLTFTCQGRTAYGPCIKIICWCRENRWELERTDTDLEEEVPLAVDWLESRLLKIFRRGGQQEPRTLSEEIGMQGMKEIITYAKRSKRKEKRRRRPALRPTHRFRRRNEEAEA